MPLGFILYRYSTKRFNDPGHSQGYSQLPSGTKPGFGRKETFSRLDNVGSHLFVDRLQLLAILDNVGFDLFVDRLQLLANSTMFVPTSLLIGFNS